MDFLVFEVRPMQNRKASLFKCIKIWIIQSPADSLTDGLIEIFVWWINSQSTADYLSVTDEKTHQMLTEKHEDLQRLIQHWNCSSFFSLHRDILLLSLLPQGLAYGQHTERKKNPIYCLSFPTEPCYPWSVLWKKNQLGNWFPLSGHDEGRPSRIPLQSESNCSTSQTAKTVYSDQ